MKVGGNEKLEGCYIQISFLLRFPQNPNQFCKVTFLDMVTKIK